jgi:carbon-monoxide dehydrogenase large subunit
MFTQIAADVLGVAPENIRVLQGDTSVAPYGLGTFASRTAVIQGSALFRACSAIKEKLLKVAAHQLEVDADDLEASEGSIRIKGTDRSLTIAEIAASIHLIRNALPAGMEVSALTESFSYDSPSEVPNEQGYGNFAANYTCSSSVVLIEVDPETGKVTILDWAAAEDVGREINPALLKGQVQGGIAQGIGYALGEDLIFDEAGTMLNPSMVDYQVPTAPVVPLFTDKLISIESLDPTHPLKYKGIGESGMTPAAGAIACAIFDAIGAPVTTLPLTPEKILNALQGIKASSDISPNASKA